MEKEKLIKDLKMIKEKNAVNFESILANMYEKASRGKLGYVTPEMIDIARKELVQESERDILPYETLELFLESEEAISNYLKDDTEISREEIITENEIFKIKNCDKEALNGETLLEDFLGGYHETI